MAAWVRTYEQGLDYLESLGGVLWADAPLPRRWHRCRAQTRGFMDRELVERCACGSIRLGRHSMWLERNVRRKRKWRRARAV